jgi:DNA-binding IclR family transcriptional regulator
MAKTNESTVSSAVRTLDIVQALRKLDGASVSEVAEYLDIPKSTTYNYLTTLEQNAYLIKQKNDYRLATRFLGIGEYVKGKLDVCNIAEPEIEMLAEKTGELSNLMIEEHGRGIYVYKAKGEDAVPIDTYAGKRCYLHVTALGKAILAQMPRERVDDIIDTHGLPSETAQTITDRERLYEELDTIRDQGIAFDREECIDGLHCVAAPIVGDNDRILGAISVSGPTVRLSGVRFEEKVPNLLKEAVNVIEFNARYS